MSRDSDWSIAEAIRGLLSAPLCAAITCIGNTPISIIQLPGAVKSTYKALIKENRIGPNLKTLAAVTIPIGIPLVLPLVSIGSFGFGFGIGFLLGQEEGLSSALEGSVDTVKEFNKETVNDFILRLDDYTPKPLPPGVEPFDIKILESLRGLLCTVVCGPISCLVGSAITAFYLPKAVLCAFYRWLENLGEVPVMATSLFIVFWPLLAVLTALAPVAGALYGIVTGAARGYKYGVSKSVKYIMKDMKQYRKLLSSVFSF